MAPVNSSHSLILNHSVISVGGKHLKYTKTLKLCEMTSGGGRCERLPARRDSYAMSITCAKLRKKSVWGKVFRNTLLAGQSSELALSEKLNYLGDRNL